jgi:hypothetical protein
MTKQMSKAQREERRSFIKLVAAVGVGAALMGGLSLAAVTMMPMATLQDAPTIAARLTEAGLADRVVLLAGEGDPDVLVVGSTDCGHCQNFIAEGLDPLLAAAAAEGWTIAYLPFPTGPASIVSTHALGLVADAADKPAALRATYALSSAIRNEALPADQQGARLAELAKDPSLTARWTAPDTAQVSAYAASVAKALDLKGTPGFYVQSADGTEVRMFSGFAGGDRIVEQIASHR